METSQVTKVCKKCGRTLPIENFGKAANYKDGLRSWCKECINKEEKLRRIKRMRGELTPNPALADFTPQQLIDELRVRGYEGTLTYTEVKVHKINL